MLNRLLICILVSLLLSLLNLRSSYSQNLSTGYSFYPDKYSNNIVDNIISYNLYEYFEFNRNLMHHDLTNLAQLFRKNFNNYEYRFEKVDTLNFPDSSYTLYNFKYKVYSYMNTEDTSFYVSGKQFRRKYDSNFLVAVKNANQSGNILFISGNFFIDDIRHFYMKNEMDLTCYLKLSLYKYSLVSLHLINKAKKFAYYSGKTKNGEFLNIRINLKDLTISIIPEKSIINDAQIFLYDFKYLKSY